MLPTLGLWLPACAQSSIDPSGVSSLSAWWWWWARCLGKSSLSLVRAEERAPGEEHPHPWEGMRPAPAPAAPSPLMGGDANPGHKNTASGSPGPCRALGACCEHGPCHFSSPWRCFHLMDGKTEACGTW